MIGADVFEFSVAGAAEMARTLPGEGEWKPTLFRGCPDERERAKA